MSNQTLKRERLATLDILKILSAFFVFSFHMFIHFGYDFPLPYINKVSRVGAIFMVLFFMLSGFLLYYNHSDRDLLEKTNLKKFFFKRFVSIYPLYFASLLLSCIWNTDMPASFNQTLLIIPLQLLGMQSFFPNTLENFGNSNIWFLSTIFVLYLIFPYLHFFVNKVVRKKWIVLLLCWLISTYAYCVLFFFGQGTEFHYFYNSPIFRIPEFLVGMILASILQEQAKKPSEFKFNFLYVIISTVLFITGVNILYRYYNGYNVYNLYNGIAIPFFASLIYLFAVSKNKVFMNISSTKIISYLGEITFPFYVAQLFAINITKNIRGKSLLLSSNNFLTVAACFLIDIILAIIFNELIVKKGKIFLLRYAKHE